MLSPNSYMFRHQSAILREFNNNKGRYFDAEMWLMFYGLVFIVFQLVHFVG
jgi:hypothetical protein